MKGLSGQNGSENCSRCPSERLRMHLSSRQYKSVRKRLDHSCNVKSISWSLNPPPLPGRQVCGGELSGEWGKFMLKKPIRAHSVPQTISSKLSLAGTPEARHSESLRRGMPGKGKQLRCGSLRINLHSSP